MPGGAQAVDERDLVGGRDVARLVLQAVTRADFDDGDAVSEQASFADRSAACPAAPDRPRGSGWR